jgi:signal transduction histidine kinase
MMLSTNQQSSTKDLSEQSRKVLAIRDKVFAEWEKRVRSLIPGADEVSHPVLLDTLPLFYGNIAEALSPGFARENAASCSSAATGHGSERARTTEYQAVEIVHEYQLLRDVLLEVAGRHGIVFSAAEAAVIGASFDQAIRDAIEEFTALQRAFRERVAASLTHDMRSPLSVVISGAELLLATAPRQARPASHAPAAGLGGCAAAGQGSRRARQRYDVGAVHGERRAGDRLVERERLAARPLQLTALGQHTLTQYTTTGRTAVIPSPQR